MSRIRFCASAKPNLTEVDKRICEAPSGKVGPARTANANVVAAYLGVARQMLVFYIQKMRNCSIKFTGRKTESSKDFST